MESGVTCPQQICSYTLSRAKQESMLYMIKAMEKYSCSSFHINE